MKLRNKVTGEIKKAEAREDGIYLWDDQTEHWWIYELDMLARGWEYYVEPKEPLIKDEKVRKAVRAWAEVLGANEVEFYGDRKWLGFRTKLIGSEYPSSFELNYSGPKNTLVAFKTYTIAELCGEEEE